MNLLGCRNVRIRQTEVLYQSGARTVRLPGFADIGEKPDRRAAGRIIDRQIRDRIAEAFEIAGEGGRNGRC